MAAYTQCVGRRRWGGMPALPSWNNKSVVRTPAARQRHALIALALAAAALASQCSGAAVAVASAGTASHAPLAPGLEHDGALLGAVTSGAAEAAAALARRALLASAKGKKAKAKKKKKKKKKMAKKKVGSVEALRRPREPALVRVACWLERSLQLTRCASKWLCVSRH